MPVGLDEGLLGDVLGILEVAEAGIRGAVDRLLVAIDKLAEGIGIAAQGTADEAGIGCVHVGSQSADRKAQSITEAFSRYALCIFESRKDTKGMSHELTKWTVSNHIDVR